MPGLPVYQPRNKVGAPAKLTQAGARNGDARESLLLLMPSYTAQTVSTQPSLFWFQGRTGNVRMVITVNQLGKPHPLLKLTLPGNSEDGVHRVKLSEHNVHLEPGQSYDWHVAMVHGERSRSDDAVANGKIDCVAPTDALTSQIKAASPSNLPFIFAENGLWFDALDSITEMIDRYPKVQAFRDQRDALLKHTVVGEASARSHRETER